MDWENFKYFIYLARLKTLQRAAKELAVSHTTVFRRVRTFEEELGTKLFEHVGKGYVLTPVGEELFKKLQNVEEELLVISRQLEGMDQRVSGRVVIATSDTLGFTVMPELIFRMKKQFSELTIELKASGVNLSMAHREADIAIRHTNSPPEGLIGRKIGRTQFSLMASPKYARFAQLDFEKNPSGHTYIALNKEWRGFAHQKWLFERLEGASVEIHEADSVLSMARLCDSGLGIALLPSYLPDHFTRLREVFKPKEDVSTDVWLLYHRDLMKSAKVRVCADFLYENLRPHF